MKLEVSDDDRLTNWETLINTIDKTDIPLEFVHNINIKFETAIDGIKEQDIDIYKFRKDGWDNNSVEQIVAEVFKECHNNIKTVHFYVDIKHVAEVVQHQTNTLLKGTL